ncbi:MAG: carbohydrate ABC transporter permease [Algisphaera sp.]
MAKAQPKSLLRTVLIKVALYGPLTVFAIITLVPFAYLACSAFKPKSVFFSSPFLPTDGLFAIDRSTGMLSVVDVTHLPEEGSASYDITVTLNQSGDALGESSLKIGYRIPEDQAAQYDFVIPDAPEVNTDLGNIAIQRASPALAENPTGDPLGDTSGRGIASEPPAETASSVPPQYDISKGNLHGFLGRAWGLLTLDNFKNLFRERMPDGTVRYSFFNNQGIGRALVNSFFFASVSSVLGVLGAAMGGYALSKYEFRGRGIIDSVVLASLVIPGAVLIAPGYQVLYWLGLLDSYAGLILPGVAPAFGVFLFRQSMRNSVPSELIEAARIDGCGELRIFFTIALPMVRPMAGALLLFGFLGSWNNFIGPQIVLSTPEKYPLAVFISQLRGVYSTDYGLIMAGTLVAIGPILVLFLLLQKEFISGLTSGAVKG